MCIRLSIENMKEKTILRESLLQEQIRVIDVYTLEGIVVNDSSVHLPVMLDFSDS